MNKGLLNWLDQALEVAGSQPLVETSDTTVSTTALDSGVAATDVGATGHQELPAEATEHVAADGASVAHGIVVVEVVASLTAAAEATAAHGAVVADVQASVTGETTETHGVVVVSSLASVAVAGESSALADGASEALTSNGAMGASAALDEGGRDWSGDVIIGLPVIIGDGFDEVVTLPLPYEGGTYDHSWSGSFSTSVGDINGDGFDDTLVATYGSDAQGNYSCGSHVVFGGAEGIDAEIDLAALDGTNGFRLLAGGGDVYGWAVSGAGDVNGDGFDDLLVGTHGYDPDGNYAPMQYLVYGAADGFGAGVDVELVDGTNGIVVEGDDDYADDGSYDYSASWSSLSSVGDINGDGCDDLLVATYGSDELGNYSFGTHIVFGSDEGIDAGIDPASLDGTNGFRLLAGGGDVYGWAVSGAGDVNGDGFGDLRVGTYGYDADGNYGGTTYLIYGAAAGFAPGVDVASLGTVVEDYDAYAGATDGFTSSVDVRSLDTLTFTTTDWL